MAELSDKYTKILSDIESHISNKDEKKYVEKKITELSSIYLELFDRLTKMESAKLQEIEDNQEKLVEKVAKIQETVNQIKNDIYEYDGYDFEIICPYCNHKFITEIEDEQNKEITCPECHNIIELDWGEQDNEETQQKSNIYNKKVIPKDDDDEF